MNNAQGLNRIFTCASAMQTRQRVHPFQSRRQNQEGLHLGPRETWVILSGPVTTPCPYPAVAPGRS